MARRPAMALVDMALAEMALVDMALDRAGTTRGAGMGRTVEMAANAIHAAAAMGIMETVG